MPFQKELIDTKAEEWINKPDLELTDLDNNKSIKTNFMFSSRNFLNIKKWANGLLAYIRYLRKLIDIDNIIFEVQNKLRTQKLYFPISQQASEQALGQLKENEPIKLQHIDPITNYAYEIKYATNGHEVIISKLTDDNFITDKMIVTVKDQNGMIVYPVIQTGGDRISIWFADKISTNYIVYVI